MDFRALKKADLHRHLEGSIRPATLLEIARDYRVPMPQADLETIKRYYQHTDHDPPSFLNYLNKFNFIRNFWVNKDAIERVAYEAVEDAARDGVVYLELRFSPLHFAQREKLPIDKVSEWIVSSARASGDKHGVKVIFIATVVRHLSFAFQEPVLRLAMDSIGSLFSGIDLAGNEIHHEALDFAATFRKAREMGLGVTVHAGEVRGNSARVRDAIEKFAAQRIGHGIYAVEDDGVVDLALDRNVTFEVCMTSNAQTGAWTPGTTHMGALLAGKGVRVTLNSDNPSVSGTILSREYETAVKNGIFTAEQIPRLLRNAAEAAFLSDNDRVALAKTLLPDA